MPWTEAGVERIVSSAFKAGKPPIYLSLHYRDPNTLFRGQKGKWEYISSGLYRRRLIRPHDFNKNAAGVGSASDHDLSNQHIISFPERWRTDMYRWGISHVGLFDSLTEGTYLGSFQLPSPILPTLGDEPHFPVNDLVFSFGFG